VPLYTLPLLGLASSFRLCLFLAPAKALAHGLRRCGFKLRALLRGPRGPCAPAAATGSSESDPSFPRVAVGDVVVRGPDWEAEDHGNTDGGPGGKGTVITVTEYLASRNRGVHVQWAASGVTNLYRWGYEGKFDVKVFSSPSGDQKTAEKASGFTVSGSRIVLAAASVESVADAATSGTRGDSSEAPRVVAVAVTSASIEWANSVPEAEVSCLWALSLGCHGGGGGGGGWGVVG
jgi:hypothetical protein